MGKNEKIFLVIVLLITVVAIGVAVWALFLREAPDTGDVNLAPDYAPLETEKNAEDMPGGGDKLDAPQGGGSVSVSFTTDVAIDISEKKSVLNFGNPHESTHDMLVQIVIQDTVLAQSGRLTPGHKVSQLDLLDGAEKKLQAGVYTGKIVVFFYDAETGEKASVNSDFPVDIQVKD